MKKLFFYLTKTNVYRYSLEKGTNKFACPSCGAKKKFRRVISTETGEYLPIEVGVCDRLNSCGYSYTWKQYFADNPTFQKARRTPVSRSVIKTAQITKRGTQGVTGIRHFEKRADYLDIDHLLATGRQYNQNTFVQFLLSLFPNDPEDVWTAVREYGIGTLDCFTVFPTITKTGKLCKGKRMKFDTLTGARLRNGYRIDSLEKKLKKAGKLKDDFETNKDIFFGEHLTAKHPNRPIAIVESEKTAVLGSICKAVFPDNVWLGSHSKQWLKVKRLKRLASNRKIFLYPDADGFEQWQKIANEARMVGLDVIVSKNIEINASTEAELAQVDLADYLILGQTEINRINTRIEAVKADPVLLAEYEAFCEERIAIMICESGLSEVEAEAYVRQPGFIRDTVARI